MDERLRQLERQAARGDGAAAAQLLVGRLRRGELTRRELELWAYLGDGAAAAALGLEAPSGGDDLRLWVDGLTQWDPWLSVRAALVAARLVLPVFERARPDDPRPARALAWSEAYLEDRAEPTRQRVFAAAAAAFDAREDAGAGPAHWAASAATAAAELTARAPEVLAGQEGHSLAYQVHATLDDAARALASEAPLRAAIAATLLARRRT